jgi:hypothetical protein
MKTLKQKLSEISVKNRQRVKKRTNQLITEETAYLMSSPKNAERLNQSIAEVDAGKTVLRRLIEE